MSLYRIKYKNTEMYWRKPPYDSTYGDISTKGTILFTPPFTVSRVMGEKVFISNKGLVPVLEEDWSVEAF